MQPGEMQRQRHHRRRRGHRANDIIAILKMSAVFFSGPQN